MQKVFKAALTMNLSMIELQGRLALQSTAPRRCSGEAIPRIRRAAWQCCKPRLSPIRMAGRRGAASRNATGRGYPERNHRDGEMGSLLRRADM